MLTKAMTGMPDYKFGIQVSVLDCTGCGSCANVCPGMKGAKALEMKPIAEELDRQKFFDYALSADAAPIIAAAGAVAAN